MRSGNTITMCDVSDDIVVDLYCSFNDFNLSNMTSNTIVHLITQQQLVDALYGKVVENL